MISLRSLETQKASASSTEHSLAAQDKALDTLRSEVQHNLAMASSMTSMIRTMSHQVSRFANLLVSVKTMLSQGFKLNIAIYRAVLSIQESLSLCIDRPLIQEPFMLEDPLGRVAPVHLQFITSWEAFHAVLTTRFIGLPGYNKIERREFVLQEGATSREISSEDPWEIAFRPGASVCMSIVFRQAAKITESNSHCPHCGSISERETSDDVHWCVVLLLALFVSWLMSLMLSAKCKMIYRRITEVSEVQPTRSGPYPKSKWAVESWDERSLSEEVRHFKRVRILLNVIKTRGTAFASDDRYGALSSRRGVGEHRRAVRNLECEHCGKRFMNSMKDLSRHVLVHHGGAVFNYPCERLGY